jgi:hypothetical protein
MPIVASAAPDGQARLTYQDPYTFEEWSDAMQVLLAVGRPLRVLVDRRGAAPLPREFVERMLAYFQRHAEAVKGWRVALVASSDVSYGMSRVLEMTAEARAVSFTIRTFRSYEEAEQWLDATA